MLGPLTSLKKGHISTGSCCRLIKASRLCGGERRCVPLRWLFVGPGWRGADFPRRSGCQDKTLVTIFLTVCCCPTNLGKYVKMIPENDGARPVWMKSQCPFADQSCAPDAIMAWIKLTFVCSNSDVLILASGGKTWELGFTSLTHWTGYKIWSWFEIGRVESCVVRSAGFCVVLTRKIWQSYLVEDSRQFLEDRVEVAS